MNNTIKPFKKILIANRGEIACRVIKTCNNIGIKTVAIYSDADQDALHVKFADESKPLGGLTPTESYLNIDKIIKIAIETNSEAIHPGYGFLSENIDFAKACVDNNIVFIGPSTEAIQKMGDKVTAIQTAMKAGVPCLPGTYAPVTYAKAKKVCDEIGYPVMVKASAGGGGIGIRKVDSAEDLEESFKQAQSLAESSFGNSKLYVEKYMTNGSHVEVQVLADLHGNAIHLFERDCSVQRRNQKIIEETPCTKLTDQKRKELWNSAIDLVKHIKYTNAGTVEFLVDEESNFYFLEMNTRLQVEHPVTEMTTNLDIVDLQIRIAAGEKLGIEQKDIKQAGHSIEARIYPEDPKTFLPTIGKISSLELPEKKNIRIDASIFEGYEVSPYYEPMMGKFIAWGRNRKECIANFIKYLKSIKIVGITHNIPLIIEILQSEGFVNHKFSTNFLTDVFPYENNNTSDEEIVAAITIALNEIFGSKSNSPSLNNWKMQGRISQMNQGSFGGLRW
tara:strand:+ start:131 stop:1645 length:1515 start_codon:yes stop_codon:yes gene_type:complete